MQALVKNVSYGPLTKLSNTWVDIDTDNIRADSYVTTAAFGNIALTDKDIIKIKDDIRPNFGRCNYCGAVITLGTEHEHYESRRAKRCNNNILNTDCFYCRNALIDSPITTTVTDPDDPYVTIVTETKKYKKQCQYEPTDPDVTCTYEECEKHGVTYYTPDNTFFLAYPEGRPVTIFDPSANPDAWDTRLFLKYYDSTGNTNKTEYLKSTYIGNMDIASYKIVIETITNESKLQYNITDESLDVIEQIHIYNSRNDYRFIFDIDKQLFVDLNDSKTPNRITDKLPINHKSANKINKNIISILNNTIRKY